MEIVSRLGKGPAMDYHGGFFCWIRTRLTKSSDDPSRAPPNLALVGNPFFFPAAWGFDTVSIPGRDLNIISHFCRLES